MNILLAGVGGQGTVLASKVIATASKGTVRTAETIGMAQRGGSVFSHVRTGNGACHSPLIPMGKADMIIGFEPAEAVRCTNYLAPNGVMVVSCTAIKPVTASLSGDSYDGHEALKFLRENVANLTVIDGEEICKKCGSIKVLNVALLGAAARYDSLGLSIEQIKSALTALLPAKALEMNFKALTLGADIK